jgi:hypothetical protein
VATDQALAVVMSHTASLELRFKIGVVKELHKRQLITKEEMDKAIKLVEASYQTDR